MTENVKIFFLEGIGNIKVVKNRRSKSTSIRIKPFEDVKVTIPYIMPFRSAIDVVKSNREWIIKSREKVVHIEQQRTVFDENTQFKTLKHQLSIRRIVSQKLSFIVRDDRIELEIPSHIDIKQDFIQDFIRKGIERAYHIEAWDYLPDRLKLIADQAGLSYNGMRLKSYKTRWGSCSSDNIINLNVHLMRIPEHLSDHIIKHELAHTVEKNHGKGFYEVLQGICQNHRELNKELKKYSIHIY